MAERQGFEPWVPFRVHTLSKRAPSATRPSLRWECALQKPLGKGHIHCSVSSTDAWSGGRERRIRRPEKRALLVFLQLLGQIVLDAHLADGVQLPFQPVDVVLLVAQNLLG